MSRILIIEDELSIAELERDYLELNDFEVEIETNGAKGLDKALENDYSLILLDLMLPDLDPAVLLLCCINDEACGIFLIQFGKNGIYGGKKFFFGYRF